MIKEEWRDIPGFPHYQASDLGNIRSVDHIVSFWNGKVWCKRKQKGKKLRGTIDRYGYPSVGLNGVGINIHRLVMLAFRGPAENDYMQADHINGDRKDNRLSNLRYVTPRQNCVYRSFRRFTDKTGIYKDKKYEKYRVHFLGIHVGYYNSFDDAKNARDSFAKRYKDILANDLREGNTFSLHGGRSAVI